MLLDNFALRRTSKVESFWIRFLNLISQILEIIVEEMHFQTGLIEIVF